jgi:hypothetical protein
MERGSVDQRQLAPNEREKFRAVSSTKKGLTAMLKENDLERCTGSRRQTWRPEGHAEAGTASSLR